MIRRIDRGQYIRLTNAIPDYHEDFLPFTRIYARQEKPRLASWRVRWCLDELVDEGKLECTTIGTRRYYRKRKQVRSVALIPDRPYNGTQRNQFSLDANVDPLVQSLAPLRQGDSVKLWMERPQKAEPKKGAERSPKILVILTPGQALGFPRKSLLVSVIGKGSAVVDLSNPKNVANLVLAGVPARLAHELLKRVSRLL